MKIHQVKQRTDKWHELRLGKLTASDANLIYVGGVGLQSLIYAKVAERITKMSDFSEYISKDMERGILLEDNARSYYELEKNCKVKQVGFIESDCGYYGFSPDGLVDDDGLIEIKSVNNANFVKIAIVDEKARAKIFKPYILQIQMQLLISERDWCDLVIFNENFDKSIYIFRQNKDKDIQDVLKDNIVKSIALIKEYQGKLQLERQL